MPSCELPKGLGQARLPMKMNNSQIHYLSQVLGIQKVVVPFEVAVQEPPRLLLLLGPSNLSPAEHELLAKIVSAIGSPTYHSVKEIPEVLNEGDSVLIFDEVAGEELLLGFPQQVFRLPSLEKIGSDPAQKRLAWEVLKEWKRRFSP